MKTSAEEILNNMEFYYENIYNLLDGFKKATTSNLSTITVPIKKKDGTIENLEINSFQKILNELSRVDNNFKSLLNENNISYIVNADGSIGQITKTSFINAEYLSNFKFGTDLDTATLTDENTICIVDTASTIKNMVFPNVKIPIIIDSNIKTDINAIIYDVVEGFESIPENPTILNLKYLINQGTIIVNGDSNGDNIKLPIEKEKVKYFGKFTVTESISSGNNFDITLANIKYSGLNFIGDSIDLKVNDILVTKNGMAKFIINEIDIFLKKLKVTRISGSENIVNGIDSLLFNEIIPNDTNIVGIPIQPNKKLVVFLSTENLKIIGYPSIGIKLNTSTYKVNYESNIYTLDEFFGTYVTNFSEYLYSIIKETVIPYNLGIEPEKPILDSSNFKVIQINSHLTNSKSSEELSTLNTEKQKIKNKLEYNQIQLEQIQNEIDTSKFKSTEEKQFRITKVTELKRAKNVLEQNLLTVARKLDNNAIESGLKNVKPKYRTIGSWAIQQPIYSSLTKAQHIIKYEIQYRYLSKNVDTVENTSMKMISNGKEISVTYSAWNPFESRTLKKVEKTDGTLVWETPLLDSVDDININQVNIPINEGESIEIKVRSISEAGYPISPKTSEWSDILRIDFPSDLTESNLATIVTKNEDDLKISEFNNILKSSGVLNHISNQVQEAEKLFLHKAEDIASGFFTAEQKNIPLFSFLKTIKNDIELLKNIDSVKNITIELIDFNNEKYTVINNTTMDLSAGNYSDNINLLDASKYGSIIRKQGFIKIKNNNLVPLELKSLVPGTIFTNQSAQNYYNVPVKTPTNLIQNSKQIIYFRNIDITGQNEDIFKLVKPRLNPTTTKVPSIYIDNSAIESSKNILYLDDDNNVKICKLLPNANNDFIAFTNEHPDFDNIDYNKLIPNFQRISLFTESIKALQYQEETDINSTKGLGFLDEDFYSVGENSCGAFLYPLISNPNSISVVGNTVISTLIIPKESEILIPFVFEYRMIDRIGKINGKNNTTINDSITYSKKIGIDLLINNEAFKFDINVSAKLKSVVTPIESLNVSSVVAGFTNEGQGTIN
jgi:hypothetical protein